MVVLKDIKTTPRERRASAQSPGVNQPNAAVDASLPEGIDKYVALFRTAQAGATTLSAARLRSDMNARAFDAPPACPMETFTTFIVREGREIGVKIYHPGTDTARPGICYFHGGGFAFGSLETFDSVASGLAEETGAVVASVEYRRLPESSYNDAQDDCYEALCWLHRHTGELNIDASRLAVAGDSVGALLATTAAMQARDRKGPPLACQLLLYGAFALEPGRPAYAQSRDPLLTSDKVEGFIELYHRTLDKDSGLTPPLSATDLSALPPALILAAERDPLRDEAFEYAERLNAAGVAATVRAAPGMVHGFLRARAMSPAAAKELNGLAATARPYLWPERQPRTKEDNSR
ncbi:alpha/beta hydrolase [Hyphococcus luteus]|uniref:Alpha/beta hydrolase n=1 Tax=Hyphococcus luteus TaxID=2058213 RepID=A0A2S7K1M4_9PROT|nr:alpha/beta hydrolase [Marinicaulis flavus]PQA86396.1 alpha/beta hydrolase [Marinicaulis flavus]